MKQIRIELQLDELKQILSLAIRAPSGDNCQPFKFEWTNQTLLIFHEAERGRHLLNNNNLASLLALGTLLESIQIVANASSWQMSLELDGIHGHSSDPWAVIRFIPFSGQTDNELLSALPERCVDRRFFVNETLPHELLQRVNSDQTHFQFAKINWLPSPFSQELIDYIKEAELLFLTDQSAVRDLVRWVRFDKKSYLETRDGMPWQNLAIKSHEAQTLHLIKKVPALWPCLKIFGLKSQYEKTIANHLNVCSGLFCLSANKRDRQSVVEAGSLAMRAWLRLNKNGFGVVPFTASSLYVFAIGGNYGADKFPNHWVSVFQRGEKVLRKAFGLAEDEVPVWMFRTGRTTPLPDAAKTLRLDLEQILRCR